MSYQAKWVAQQRLMTENMQIARQGSHGSGQPLVSRYWTAARKPNLRKYHRALLAALAGGVDNTTLIQYYRQNKNFSYHFHPESKNSPLRVRHTRRKGSRLWKIPANPQQFYYVRHFAALFLAVSLESTSIKPLRRLASASVTRSQWLAKTMVRLPAARKRLARTTRPGVGRMLTANTPHWTQHSVITSE